MKNVLKIFGIIALVAAIGFSMIACGDKDGGGATYTTFVDTSTDHAADFTSKFGGTPPASQGYVALATKSKAELLAACEADAGLLASKTPGVTYAEIKKDLDSMFGDTPANTMIKNEINSKGYALIGINTNGSKVVVSAVFKE